MNHRWPELGTRMAEKTERECLRGCGVIKVTMHPGGRRGPQSYTEYWRGEELIGAKGSRVPKCEPWKVEA